MSAVSSVDGTWSERFDRMIMDFVCRSFVRSLSPSLSLFLSRLTFVSLAWNGRILKSSNAPWDTLLFEPIDRQLTDAIRSIVGRLTYVARNTATCHRVRRTSWRRSVQESATSTRKFYGRGNIGRMARDPRPVLPIAILLALWYCCYAMVMWPINSQFFRF